MNLVGVESSRKRRPVVLLTGYFHRGNFGDDAMHVAIGSFFEGHSCDMQIDECPLPPLRMRGLIQIFRFIGRVFRADVVILVGGTHLHEPTRAREWMILTGFLALVLFVRLRGRKFGLCAVGIGPVFSRMAMRVLSWILSRVDAILVRDRQSYELVRSLVKSHVMGRVSLGTDLVTLLPLEEKASSDQEEGKSIVVSLVPSGSIRVNKAYHLDQIVHKLWEGDFRERLRGVIGYIPRVVAIPFYRGEGDNDLGVSIRAVNGIEEAECLDDWTGLGEVTSQIANAKVLLAARYHAIWCGYLCGVPTLIMPYHQKCRNLAAELDLPRKCIVEWEDLKNMELLKDRVLEAAKFPDRFLSAVPVTTLRRVMKGEMSGFLSHLALRVHQ